MIGIPMLLKKKLLRFTPQTNLVLTSLSRGSYRKIGMVAKMMCRQNNILKRNYVYSLIDKYHFEKAQHIKESWVIYFVIVQLDVSRSLVILKELMS